MDSIRKVKNQKLNIKYIGLLILVSAGLLFAADNIQYPGLMPEVVVTAPRYNAGETAMMPEVLVTAPQYRANENMMPEITVTAPRPAEPVMDIALASSDEIYPAQPVYDDVVYDAPAAYKQFKDQLYDIEIEQNESDLGFTPVRVKVKVEHNAKRVGKLIIEQGDTINEDLEFSGSNGFIQGTLEGDLSVMGGDMEVTSTGRVNGDVVVLGGSLANNGMIKGDIAVLGGNFHNIVILDGDIFVAGGHVKLDSGSKVNGAISMIGGSLERDTNAYVKGEIKTVEIKVLGKTIPKFANMIKLSEGLPRMFTRGARSLVGIIMIIGFFVISLLVVLIFPKPVEKVAETTHKNVWIPIAIGVGIQLIIVPLIVLLAVSIIGIPIIPLFILALFACLVMGLASIYYLIGLRVRSTDDTKSSTVAKFAIGFIIVMAIPLLGAIVRVVSPVGGLFTALGAVIIYVVATIGMGAAFFTLVSRKKQ